MEINNNIPNTSVNDVSTLSSSINIDTLNNTQKVEQSKNNSFSLDRNISINRSDLSNTLKEFTKEISKVQVTQSQLQSQTNILNDMQTLTHSIISSENPQKAADEAQPSIEAFINMYNTNSVQLSANQEDTDSTTYFDGKIGAKPLSTSEILEAVEKQMAFVNQQNEQSSKNLQELETRALNTIGKEIEQSAQKAPFEPIDFGKDIGNFSSANINNIVGSVATSQANAIPANSPKLLA